MQPPRLSDRVYAANGHPLGEDPRQAPRSRVMRRRIVVFFSVFLACAFLSLGYTFMRPAIYMATARVQVLPPAKSAVNDVAAQQDNNQAFLVEMQVFNSRPLLEKVVPRLKERGQSFDAAVDPVLMLQNMLTINPVGGTNVAEIEAQGPQRLLVANLVNTVIDVYREEQARAGEASSRSLLADAREESRVLDQKVAERKKVVEAFRLRANIVSVERDENQVLSRLKGLGTSLSTANEREAAAEGKLRALEQSIAEGKHAQLSKDNPTLAGMEQRLSQWREEWRALERQFTPNYLAMDPNAKALKMRIDSLEQQLEVERGKSQQNALAAAQEELTSTRAANRRLQQQLAEDKQSVQGFSRSFADFKGMQDELEGLEKMRQAAQQRLLGLEASESARKPRVQVVELANTPESAWRPLYLRDAAISVAASLALGFLAVWFVEFFNRAEAVPTGPSTVIIPQPWMADPYPGADNARLPGQAGGPRLAAAAPDVPRLSLPMPRELTSGEVEKLLLAAAPENQPMLACLLCGLSAEELAALRLADVDTAHQTLAVPGDARRVLPLPLALLEALKAGATAAPEGPLFDGGQGSALRQQDIQAMVTSSAHDAYLAHPENITPEALRHTYIAFLVRQGLRFSELHRIVGRLSAEALNALAALAPPAERVSLQAIDPVMPAVNAWTGSRAGTEA